MSGKDIVRVPARTPPRLVFHGEYPFDNWSGIWLIIFPVPLVVAYELYKDAVRRAMLEGSTVDNLVLERDDFHHGFVNKCFLVIDARGGMVRAVTRADTGYILIESDDSHFCMLYDEKQATLREKLAPFKKSPYPHTHGHEATWLNVVLHRKGQGGAA